MKLRINGRIKAKLSETDYGLRLKICFVPYATGLDIKTAYTPNDEEIRIHKKYGERNDGA
ncbi:MAG: hypothetical protein GX772_00330 [Alcaligenaceae bacterium]|nr:hypothetical protein [Alcaligenaceae bacterium]